MRKSKKWLLVGTIFYLIVIALPVMGALENKTHISWDILSYRRIALLWNSIKLGGLTAILASIIGVSAALFIRTSYLRDKWYRYFFVMLLPVPYYLYALSWTYLVRFLAGWNDSLLKYSMQGFGACLFVEVMTYIPLAMLFALIGLESINERTVEMALIYKGSNATVRSVLLRVIMPYLTAAVGCILVLSVTDFSVPSMFQYNTYTLEIFSTYSRTGSVQQVYIMTIPLFIIMFVPFLWLVSSIRKIGMPQVDQKPCRIRLHGGLKIFSVFSFVLVLLQIVIPLIMYAIHVESFMNLWTSFLMIKNELSISIKVAIISAVVTVMLVLLPAQWLAERKSMFWWILFLFSMIIPGAIHAIGLLFCINGSLVNFISSTILMPALGCAIKFAPMLLLWCTVVYKRMDKKRLEMAEVMAHKASDILKIKYRMLLNGLLCIMALAFFLTIGEEGVMLVLMAPGQEAASVKIYNYLHYGASEYVSGFCLIITLFIFAMELIMVAGYRMMYGRKKRGRLF